jgi:hypothetical protein
VSAALHREQREYPGTFDGVHRSQPANSLSQPTQETIMRTMTEDQIPQFVRDLVDLDIEISAIDDVGYCLDDSELPEAVHEAIAPRLHRILQGYGHRTHLKREIIAYLYAVGRVVELDESPAMRDPDTQAGPYQDQQGFPGGVNYTMVIHAPRWWWWAGAIIRHCSRRPPP